MADDDKKADHYGPQEMYHVNAGETLWDIAERTMGRGDRWTEIVEANKELLGRRAWLPAGTDIKIPGGFDPSAL